MKKVAAAGVFCAVLLAWALPAQAQLLGPLPVVDLTGNITLGRELVQELYQGVTLGRTLDIAIQNTLPTEMQWGEGIAHPTQMVPLVTQALNAVTNYNDQVQAHTGVPVPMNPALEIVRRDTTNMAIDEADLRNAQTASDNCAGDLCAQQTTHRFNQLAVTQQIEQKQFDEATYAQQKADEAAALSWMTTPGVAVPAQGMDLAVH